MCMVNVWLKTSTKTRVVKLLADVLQANSDHETISPAQSIFFPFWSELEFVKIVKGKHDHQCDLTLLNSSDSP